MLFWHKHNIEKSLADLPNFTPFPDEWTVEDKVLFEQAFSFHGKTFHRIQQMVSRRTLRVVPSPAQPRVPGRRDCHPPVCSRAPFRKSSSPESWGWE